MSATAKNEPEIEEDSSSCSSEEDDDLVLEGVLRRNQDVLSSDDDDDEEEEEEDEENGDEISEPKAKKQKVRIASHDASTKSQKEKTNQKSNEPETIEVEFNFCDMDEKYFHGMKTHLLSEPVYAQHSSSLSDLMIENVSVGTVISCDDGQDNVFGFASVLRVMADEDGKEADSIKAMKDMCLSHCPKQHKKELNIVFSGKTKRPAGFLIHCRMVNLPLEITLVLHQQLVLDMDWAVNHAEGGEEERKSLDFGAFVLLAPCTRSDSNHGLIYKKFDDEIFSTHAEFVYTFDAPKRLADQDKPEKQLVSVIVLTKTGHRAALKDMEKMVGG